MKIYNKIDKALVYILVFFLGMFSAYLMIGAFNCRIILIEKKISTQVFPRLGSIVYI